MPRIVVADIALLALLAVFIAACVPSPTLAPSPIPDVRPSGVPAKGEDAIVDAIYERGTLNACAAVAMPIVGLDTNTNQFFGIGPDFAQELAKRMGVNYNSVGAEWDTLIPNVQAGKCDLIVAGLGYRSERAEVVDYVLLELKAGTCYVARKDDLRVNSFDDIVTTEGVTACGITGTGYEQRMRSDFPHVDFYAMPAPGAQGLVEEVLTGRCDVTPYDNWVVPYMLEKYPQVRAIPADCVVSPLETYDWGFAVLKGYPGWLGYVQRTVNELQDSAQMDEWIEYHMSAEQMEKAFIQ